MSLKSLSPQAVTLLLEEGALLIDIRPQSDYLREHIAQARHMPTDQLVTGAYPLSNARAIIFYCRSGHRTQLDAQTLKTSVNKGEAYVLEGGLNAWKKAGLPVVRDLSQPLPLQRQVQITAGLLIMLATVLGFVSTPAFFVLSGLIGTGLFFAGITGFCGLARLLAKMPWNRRVAVQTKQ